MCRIRMKDADRTSISLLNCLITRVLVDVVQSELGGRQTCLEKMKKERNVVRIKIGETDWRKQ